MENDSLHKEDLNPCLAEYGYYGIKKGKVILKQFVLTEQHGEYNLTYLFNIKKDTLELIYKDSPEYKYIYTYIPIPKYWLEFTPD